ncbi:MAG TPA: chromosome segregation protein SMC [Thermoflexales bacterium]|nr:chromosome segregation protein SMC [Thermoflexales bacterium]
MRLKRLTLTGYKTFASKTMFEFADGITAVIGPNGSGKSNVADSIRWALGEQSYSLLRGKRTDDMIFSGSARRPRASMAEVLLTFDNSDGFFPVEFSEIELGRRAYRDGSNEYILNGNRVRLRDIAELLSHTGLAERTYTVIGQGLVDTALTQKPEERRALFEEAAGVAVYRDKREDALRKLEETQGNLNRARDILAEITPRLKQLERQTERARQFETLQSEMNGYLRTWFAFTYHKLRGMAAASAASRDSLRGEAGAARAIVEEKEQITRGLREKQNALRAQIAQALPQRDEARRNREALNRDLAVLRERAASFNAQMAATQREMEEQTAAMDGLSVRVAQAAASLTAAQDGLARRQREMEAAQLAAADQQAARAALEQQRAEAQKELMRINAGLVSAANRARELRGRQGRLAQQLSDLTKRAERLTGEREAEMNRAKSLDGQAQQDADKIQNLNAAFEAAAHNLEAARSAMTNALSEQAAAEAEEKMTARMTLFQEMRAQQSSDDLAAMAQRAKLPGLRGPLASHIKIHPDDQRAVEAAFGESLNALVIESGEELGRARAWLASLNSSGKLVAATLRDLARLSEGRAEADARLAEQARARNARPVMDVITAPDWLKPSLKAIAGRAFITRDLDAARALAAELGEGCACVTRDGEVAGANGVLLLRAGKHKVMESAPVAEAITLITPEEAKAKADAARTARAQAQTALDAARRRQDEAARARDFASREMASRRATRDDLDRRIARYEDQLAQTAGEISSVDHEQAQLVEQINALEAAIGQDKLDQVTAEDALTAFDAQLREQLKIALQPSLFEESSAVNEAGLAGAGWMGQLNAASAAVASASEGVRSAANLHRERVQALNDAQARGQSRATRLEQLRNQQADAEAQLAQLTENAHKAEAAAREADALITPIQGELNASEAEIVAAEDTRREHERALREKESQLNALELELLRHQDELDSLEERARDQLPEEEDANADGRRKTEDGLALDDGRQTIDDGSAPADVNQQPATSNQQPVTKLANLPQVDELPEGMEERMNQLRGQIKRLGAINFEAAGEYEELSKRFTFLTEQSADLDRASEALRQVITELNEVMNVTFRQTFEAIANAFAQTFKVLFGGGQAKLTLVNAENIDEAAVEISAQPPGKRPQTLALLSGGERSLTAAALLFAILRVKPTPLCVLDEVDAALDEANVGRFRGMLQNMADNTQFVVITHNRGTVEAANTIYGVSMGADGASIQLSLRLEDVKA